MTRDRIYDEVVSRLVQSGEVRGHDFDALLGSVAEPADDEGSRWFLREGDETARDVTESAREEAAARIVNTFLANQLENTHEEGVHYSDVFEDYLYSVKDKPRMGLLDLLAEYFYKTEDGRWRPPASKEEEELKSRARAAGTNRRIKGYVALLSAGVAVPGEKVPSSTTLVEWIRHAKRTGLFEVGKLLYERGGLDVSKLSEEMAVGVEEDYQVCARTLARGMAPLAAKAKRSRG